MAAHGSNRRRQACIWARLENIPAGTTTWTIGDLPEFIEFHRGRFHPRRNPPSRLLRAKAMTRDLTRWMVAVRERLDPDAPVLLVMPLHDEATWLDLIAGEPTSEDLISLRTIGRG